MLLVLKSRLQIVSVLDRYREREMLVLSTVVFQLSLEKAVGFELGYQAVQQVGC